ncbi:hypothetical protein F3K40_31470 [Streptomyces sp. LBUM 1478]|uniref:hypothetical protein n=1 Tax=Streptomyces TaxID=1883 RepID=UPI001DFF5F55|nr:hypothetical protein [Streptomyces sp. LBUM 1478]
MDARAPHPALDPAIAWPTLGMWVRWEGERLDLVSLAPARGTTTDQVLLPCSPELLIQLGKISLGNSRAGLYAVRLAEDGADHRLVLCQRGWEGAVRISGAVSSIAEPLYGKTRAAMLAAGREQRAAGNQDDAAQWSTMARQLLLAKRSSRRGRSVRTISGGLPTLGKHG